MGIPWWLSSKEPTVISYSKQGDEASVPGSGRYFGEGHYSPFQYSCQENPMDRGAWQAAVHGAGHN